MIKGALEELIQHFRLLQVGGCTHPIVHECWNRRYRVGRSDKRPELVLFRPWKKFCLARLSRWVTRFLNCLYLFQVRVHPDLFALRNSRSLYSIILTIP